MRAAVAVRAVRPEDAGALAALIGELGYEVTESEVRERLVALGDDLVLVADDAGTPVGCASLAIMRVLHRPAPVGRISMLVVTQSCRGAGIGRSLVDAAETRLRGFGCGLVEVTSNERLIPAHAFYEGLGFERTSFRFAKTLEHRDGSKQ